LDSKLTVGQLVKEQPGLYKLITYFCSGKFSPLVNIQRHSNPV